MGVPKRIQRKRTKGWKMPPNAVYVGRPTQWGNPYYLLAVLPEDEARALAVEQYREYLDGKTAANGDGRMIAKAAVMELRGKDLACWCPLVDKDGNRVPCHADILLEIANA